MTESVELIKRISKTFKGVRYEILLYNDGIIWKSLNNLELNNWDNRANLFGGALSFDFNTFVIKGLGSKWTDKAFELFGNRINKIKVEWKLASHYPNGESLGHKQFWEEMDNSWDKIKSVKTTTFYKIMKQKGFNKVDVKWYEEGLVTVELIK